MADSVANLIHELSLIEKPDWAETALLSCLKHLQVNQVTEAALVRVLDAWVGPGESFSLVYVPPWGEEPIGLRRDRNTLALGSYPDYEFETSFSAESFGRSVAIWDIGEPVALNPGRNWRDSAGVYWWGDLGEATEVPTDR